MTSLLTNRPIKYTLITFIVMGIILITLPLAIQFGAEYAIKEQGAKKVNIEDINLNLFTGKFELKNLSATFNEQPALTLKRVFVELKMSELIQSRVVVQHIDIKGLNAQVIRDENGSIDINGYTIPAAKETESKQEPSESKPIEFAVNAFKLIDSALIYKEKGFEQNLVLSNIAIKNIKSWDENSITDILINIQEGKTVIESNLKITLFTPAKSVKGSLIIHGLNSQTYKKFHDQHIDNLQANIDVDVQFDMTLGQKIQGSVEHSIALTQLNAQYQKLGYTLDKLTSKGKAIINGSDISVDASVQMDNSKLVDVETSTPLNAFKSLTLTDLHYDATKTTFKQLSLKGIDVLENPEKKTLLSLAYLALNEFSLNTQQSTLDLALVELQQPDINATLSKQKQLTHLTLINPILERFKTKPKQTPAPEEAKPKKPMAINIKQVRLTKPGLLHFNDLSVEPIYSTKLHFNNIEVDDASSEHPAQFKLALKQGEYTTIDIDGQGLLFNPVENLSYTIDIKQLDLPPISSYTSKTMGYGVKSGVIDTVIKGSIKQQQIDTKVVLKIDSIEVIETDKETAAEISGASGMSIGLALSTLEDKNKVIDLELPIGGDIKKPDFDLSLIINKAMGIAMKSAAFGYFKHALQPFSSLVTLFNFANDASNSISLAPISFAVNKTELIAEQKQLLDKVSNILNERPGIKIKTCGITSLSDKTAINAQLLKQKEQAYLKKNKGKKQNKKLITAALKKLTVTDTESQQAVKNLADKRSASVKAYLSKVKKIDSAKILNCLSAENLKPESKPVVELVI